jgi:hypothetical protein
MIPAKDAHLKCGKCRNIAKANGCVQGCGNRVWRKGGRCSSCHRPGIIKRNGYVMLYRPDHHRSQGNGYVFEHIVVMEAMIGRPLIDGENVHHKNSVRDDNSVENLELWSKSQPYGARIEDRVADAIRILELYRPEALASNATI